MKNLFDTLRQKALRDLQKGPRVFVRNGVRVARELLTAPLHLRGVNEVGRAVRTLRAPRIDNQGFMRIGGGTILRSVNVPVELATGPEGRLEIGDRCFINYGASIGALSHIVIGNRVNIGTYVMIIDSEFHGLYDRDTPPAPEPVRIEDDVWIGSKASILPGVTIGRGAVVGTGSVVTKDVPPFAVVAGVPAKVVRELDPVQLRHA